MGRAPRSAADQAWQRHDRAVVGCRRCPRLVAHREKVAAERRRQYSDWQYWGKPVPGFGDRGARVLIVGLAPAAHGANRTGRMFTGDRSGDWLYGALHAVGFANQPQSTDRNDGLALRGAYISAVARCAPPANRPTPEECASCRPFLAREIELLHALQVVVVLGQIAMQGFLAAWHSLGRSVPRPRPKFAHGAALTLDTGVSLVASYHPSQQNTFTGRLTREMLLDVFRCAAELSGRI